MTTTTQKTVETITLADTVHFDPTTIGLSKDWGCLTNYSDLKG